MIYQIAEKFVSIQGEGVHCGTPMAFIRLVGCSVGKKICSHCDTAFEKILPWNGGGPFTEMDLLLWAAQSSPSSHVSHIPISITGGEPFDYNLLPFFDKNEWAQSIHIETSGTVDSALLFIEHVRTQHSTKLWISCSPKPGFIEEVVLAADEVKVIVPGLGAGPGPQAGQGWPLLEDALRWAAAGKTVFLQPRNERDAIHPSHLALCQELVLTYPQLKLSVQLHKLLRVR